MNLGAIQEALRLAVGIALGQPDVGRYQAVVWGDTKQSSSWNQPGAARVRLTKHDGATQGQDGVFLDADGKPVVSGPRNFWVSVRIEKEQQTVGLDAEALAGKLIAGLRFPRVSKLLDAADVSISTVRPPVNSSYPKDDRRVSVAIVDLVCQSAENLTDTAETVGTFNTIQVGPSSDSDNDLKDATTATVGPPT